MLGGQKADDGAGARFVRKLPERGADRSQKARVGALHHEPQLGRSLQVGVRYARVIQRPIDHFFDEAVSERGERRALGAGQDDDDGGAVRQAVVEQITRQRVVLGAVTQLANVLGCSERAHASASPAGQLVH